MLYLDIVFYAVVAAFLAIRLKDVLGKKTEDVESGEAPKLLTTNERSILNVLGHEDDDDSGLDDALEAKLKNVKKHHPAFHLKDFLRGARQAFRMIVVAYAEGDRAALKDLLTNDMYKAFEDSLEKRDAEGLQVELEKIRVESSEVVNVEIKKASIFVTVKFLSEQTQTTLDKDGEPVSDNEGLPEDVVDYWTFSRTKTSTDPNWSLTSTYSEE